MAALIDPVDAFFSAISSIFGRAALGFGAIGAALMIHAVGYGWDAFDDMPNFLLAIPFMLTAWSGYGVFYLVGVVAVLTMLVTLLVFIQDSCGKRGYFVIFTAAAVYLSPISFPRDSSHWNWLVASILYALISVVYWRLPTITAFIAARSQPEKETDAAAVPPKTAFQQGWEQRENPPRK